MTTHRRWQKSSLEAAVAGVVICVLITCGTMTFQSIRRMQRNAELVEQSHEALSVLDRLESFLKDAETGAGGFLITGDDEHLAPFEVASQNISRLLQDLAARTTEVDRQQSGIKALSELIEQKTTVLNTIIQLRREKGMEAAKEVLETGVGIRIMDAIRTHIAEMRAREDHLLDDRNLATAQAYETALWTALISTLTGLSLVGAVFISVQYSRKKTEKVAAILFVERERLRESAEFTRSIVDTLGELVVVLDREMKVLHVNRAFSSTFQITDDRILGRSIFQLDGGQWDLPVLHELLDETISRSSPAAHVEIEQHLAQVGRKVLRMTASRFAAGSERREAVLLVMSDVTDERVLEEANRRQDQQMRWFLEQIKDYAIFTMDADCNATSWNQGVKEVLGYDEAEFIGHDIRKLIFTTEAQAEGIPETEFSLAALDQRASDDRWMMRKGGEHFWASGITTSIRDDHDHLIGYSKVMRDLTSRKRAQDELAEIAARLSEMDRRKNEFLATLAHELRNPLAPIKNAVQLMGLLKLDPEL
ncbi:MAG: CHASE3 domain-containing protein, partial [Fuerstia sp.]|nr:CHASE3 domain-containing protein [Fuerstiella sp.]